MVKISCYKTTQEKLSRAFCNLAEKCYHNAIKIFVYTNSKEQAFELDTVLWIYSRKQFIPHGTIYDILPEKQPILIGSELKNFNNSSSMIIFNPDESKILSILSSTKDFDISKCERLFFLHDNISSLSNQNINNIIIKSPLLDFRLDFYVQADNNTWYVQNNVVNE
jgi:DNA polymerase-3 subunit chi